MALLLEPLNDVLGSSSKVRLLRIFARSHVELSVRESSRLAAISHVSALQALDTLAVAGILNRKILGRQHAYRLNDDNVLVKAVRALFMEEAKRIDAIRTAVAQIISGASDDVVGTYMIGSAARGEDVPGSDLDLLVLVRRSTSVEGVHSAIASEAVNLRSRYGVSVSPIVITAASFRRMHAERDSFARSAVKDARTVAGSDIQVVINGKARSNKES